MAEIRNPFRLLASSPKPPPPPTNIPEDDLFVKRGIMRVGQKGKKLFVMLHQDHYNFSAQVTVYESEKKYRSRSAPKFEILLKNVRNVNRAVHSKIPHCMVMFTVKETWHIGCDTQDEMESWFNAIFNVYCGTQQLDQDVILRGNFDYVWDVTVPPRHLALKCPELSGEHRFCLNVHSFYLYKLGDWQALAEFPLVCVATYALAENKFSVTLGRSAAQGPGTLLFKLGDPLWAQNMHDVLKRILEENHALRVRSSSDASSKTGSSGGIDQGTTEHSKSDTAVDSGATVRPRTRSTVEGHNTVRGLQQHLSTLNMRSHGKGVVMTSEYPGGSSDRLLANSNASATSLDSSRSNRYATDSVNHLPVLKESGGSGSGGELLPIEAQITAKRLVEAGSSAYIQMNVSSNDSSTTRSSEQSYNLEEVRSYVSDGSFGSSSATAASKPHDRAYSLGSKPPGAPSSAVAATSLNGPTKFGAGRLLEVTATIETDDSRRPRANSFGNWQSRGRGQSSGSLSQRFYDNRTSTDSRSGSFGSTGRRLTGSSYRSNFSEDLVEMDFGAGCGARTASLSSGGGAGRSPGSVSVASSSDSLATAAVGLAVTNNRSSRGGSAGSGGPPRSGGPSSTVASGPGARAVDPLSPAARLVAQSLTVERGDYMTMEPGQSPRNGGAPVAHPPQEQCSNERSSDYVPMEAGRLTQSVPSANLSSQEGLMTTGVQCSSEERGDYVPMDAGASSHAIPSVGPSSHAPRTAGATPVNKSPRTQYSAEHQRDHVPVEAGPSAPVGHSPRALQPAVACAAIAINQSPSQWSNEQRNDYVMMQAGPSTHHDAPTATPSTYDAPTARPSIHDCSPAGPSTCTRPSTSTTDNKDGAGETGPADHSARGAGMNQERDTTVVRCTGGKRDDYVCMEAAVGRSPHYDARQAALRENQATTASRRGTNNNHRQSAHCDSNNVQLSPTSCTALMCVVRSTKDNVEPNVAAVDLSIACDDCSATCIGDVKRVFGPDAVDLSIDSGEGSATGNGPTASTVKFQQKSLSPSCVQEKTNCSTSARSIVNTGVPLAKPPSESSSDYVKLLPLGSPSPRRCCSPTTTTTTTSSTSSTSSSSSSSTVTSSHSASPCVTSSPTTPSASSTTSLKTMTSSAPPTKTMTSSAAPTRTLVTSSARLDYATLAGVLRRRPHEVRRRRSSDNVNEGGDDLGDKTSTAMSHHQSHHNRHHHDDDVIASRSSDAIDYAKIVQHSTKLTAATATTTNWDGLLKKAV